MTMRKRHSALTRMLLVSTILSLTSACETTVVSDCSWARAFIPDPGFETRWTRNEKVQAVQHNEKVAKFCGVT